MNKCSDNFSQSLLDLTGKTALITGASGGLGEQYARTLSNSGARVILTGRRMEKIKSISDSIPGSIPQEMDITKKASIATAFANFEKQGCKIDICVNNAGILKPTPVFGNSDNSNFEDVLQTNLTGVWYVIQAVANHMKSHSICGSIINIGGVRGDAVPSMGGSAYCVSKAAIHHLTKTLVGELSAHNIRINCINPGLFPTDLTRRILESNKEQVAKQIPLGFIPNLVDMDGTLLYLASNAASRYVTGSIMTVDGGVSWGGGF